MDLHTSKLSMPDFRPIVIDTVFRSGQFFTEWGKELEWVAVRLPHDRWTIYTADAGTPQDFIVNNGEILTDDKLIQKLVPTTKDVFECYWKGGEKLE